MKQISFKFMKVGFVFILTIFAVNRVFALPPNDFEPWRMYATYENGYEAGKSLDSSVSHLQWCMEQSDHSDWKGIGWDDKIIRKADKLFFYGCIMNIREKKMTKPEFMKKMFKSMLEKK